MEPPPFEHPPSVRGMPYEDIRPHLVQIITAEVSSSEQHLCCIQKAALYSYNLLPTSILNIHYQIYLTLGIT